MFTIIIISHNIHLWAVSMCWLGTVSALWGAVFPCPPLYFSFAGQNLLAKAVISLFLQSLAQNLPRG